MWWKIQFKGKIMDLNFGINGSFGVAAARPITISSSTPIGIVATADVGDFGLMKFNNADEGLEYIKSKNIANGTLEAVLTGISLQAVNKLKTGGYLAFEIDSAQNENIRNLLDSHGWRNITTIKDYNKLPRVILATNHQ